jgi:hypothetical protein
MFGADDEDISYVLSLPPGVNVELERGDGDVTGTLVGASGRIRTEGGDVRVTLERGSDERYLSDGALDITTDSGDVTVESDDLPLNLRAVSEDDVVVNGENQNGRYRSPSAQSGLDVDIDTQDGDVVVEMPDPVTSSSSGSGSTLPTIPPTPTIPPIPTTPSVPSGD